jgi:hypothetical protein
MYVPSIQAAEAGTLEGRDGLITHPVEQKNARIPTNILGQAFNFTDSLQIL